MNERAHSVGWWEHDARENNSKNNNNLPLVSLNTAMKQFMFVMSMRFEEINKIRIANTNRSGVNYCDLILILFLAHLSIYWMHWHEWRLQTREKKRCSIKLILMQCFAFFSANFSYDGKLYSEAKQIHSQLDWWHCVGIDFDCSRRSKTVT